MLVRAASGAAVALADTECADGSNTVFATAATVDINDGSVSNAGNTCILAERGATVNARRVSIDGQSNSYFGARSIGSRVDVGGGSAVNCQDSDLVVEGGGFVVVNGTATTSSTGSDPHEADMSVSPNTLTSNGVIFADSTEA